VAKIMKPEAPERVLHEMFNRVAGSGEFLGPLAAFAVLPLRHHPVLADFDDLAQ
jgi:hypothetical protein